jgi:hypothetical protein
VKSYIVPVIGPVIDCGQGANFQSPLDFGRVVDQELKGDQVLTFLYVDGKGSVPYG